MESVKIDESLKTYETKKGLYNKWIPSDIRKKTLFEIRVQDIEAIKITMIEKKMAPDTIKKTINIVTQVFKFSSRMHGYNGEILTTKIKVQKKDNKRDRFLTKKEADALLEELSKSSEQLHDIAIVSLYCGLRAGEIFKLEWQRVDFENNRLLLKDRKNGQNIQLPMHNRVREMLIKRKSDNTAGLVFKSRKGKKLEEVSDTYSRAVKRLGLNNNITDPHQKVVFHTLRHTYASWLVMSDVDLYTVQRLLGHKDITMTQRYAHLAPEHLDKAVSVLT